MKIKHYNRREFIIETMFAGAIAGISGLSLISGCTDNKKEEKVSPIEDLMREHGVLNRILLVYDTLITRLTHGEQFPLNTLTASAGIIRTFIEDYHEKLEEDYLFPRFLKANQLAGLIQVLWIQHKAGRTLTEQIINIAKSKTLSTEETKTMIKLLTDFNKMYRPHEAREDTILFPALSTIISSTEYDNLGEDFENKEHQLFGEGGFHSIVYKVAEIEKQLDIYDLSKFTPVV